MPFTFLAHQAPVLPLKLWKPRWFSGTGLVIGSMAPDFEYCVWIDRGPVLGHSLLGQLTFCLPLTLAITFVLTRCVASPLAASLPSCGPFHVEDYRHLALTARGFSGWLKVASSALLASLSHLLIDGFTHANGFGARWFPSLLQEVHPFGLTMTLVRALQYAATFGGGPLCVALLWRIGATRSLPSWLPGELAPAPTRLRTIALLWAPLALGAAWGARRAIPVLTDPTLYIMDPDPVYLGAYGVYIVMCHAFVGLAIGAAALRLLGGSVSREGPPPPVG